MTQQTFKFLTIFVGNASLCAALLLGSTRPVAAQNEASTSKVAPQNVPQLRFETRLTQATLGKTYDGALDNLLRLNTVPDLKNEYNRAGLMATPGDFFMRAGGGYNTPWTRDASLNSWNAGSLLEPVVARNTLWAVCEKQADGEVVLQRDNQWWDKVIWISAAWNHYKVTGDQKFLAQSYAVTQDELALMRREHFNTAFGLFQGPAFFCDGIAGYPEPIFDPKINSSFVLDYPLSKDIMSLGTNCVYYAAYRNAALMAHELKRPATEAKAFNDSAATLKTAINRHLWMPDKGTYAYFIYGSGPLAGRCDGTQEGIGLSFALLFGVADAEQTKSLLANTHRSAYGITTSWPHFPRFSDDKPGRHNVSVWPMVNGMWACALAQKGDVAGFGDEVENLALLTQRSEGRFYEIYNFQSGTPDGGWQGWHWGPLADQTWSATGYLRMIYQGLFGMDFQPEGLHLSPKLPSNWGKVQLSNVHYRGMTLDVALRGQGARVARVVLDGAPAKTAFIPATWTGPHSIIVTMR